MSILAFDIGYDATGWALLEGLLANGKMIAYCDVIRPKVGLSPKSLHDKRSCDRHAVLMRRLFDGIGNRIKFTSDVGDAAKDVRIVAEAPTMGAKGAAAIRCMAAALACFECAMPAANVYEHERYIRSDVLAAIYGGRPPTMPKGMKPGAKKAWSKGLTSRVVDQRFAIEWDGLAENLREHVYDAIAVLFAARDAPSVKAQGWSKEAMNCLRPIEKNQTVPA